MAWGDIVGAAGESLGGLSSAISAGTIVAQEKQRQAALDAQKAIDDEAARKFTEARTEKINYELGAEDRATKAKNDTASLLNLSPKKKAIYMAGGPEALQNFQNRINMVLSHHGDKAQKGELASPVQMRSELINAGEDMDMVDRYTEQMVETNRLAKESIKTAETEKHRAELQDAIAKETAILPIREASQKRLAQFRLDEGMKVWEEKQTKIGEKKKTEAKDKRSLEADKNIRLAQEARFTAGALKRAVEDHAGWTNTGAGWRPPFPKSPTIEALKRSTEMGRYAGTLIPHAIPVIGSMKLPPSGDKKESEKLTRLFQLGSNMANLALILAPRGFRSKAVYDEIRRHAPYGEDIDWSLWEKADTLSFLMTKFEHAQREDIEDPQMQDMDWDSTSQTLVKRAPEEEAPPLPLELRNAISNADAEPR